MASPRLPASRVPPKRGRFAQIAIDRYEFRHADGTIHMFLAIDRVSKFAIVAFYEKAGKTNGAAAIGTEDKSDNVFDIAFSRGRDDRATGKTI